MCAVKVLVVSMLCGAKFIRRESARSSTMNASFLYEKIIIGSKHISCHHV